MSEALNGFRLSPQQRHLWRAQEAAGGRPFTARCAFLLEGELDGGRLENAVADVVRRHEILRTAFKKPPQLSEALQFIEEPPAQELERHDLQARSAAEQEAWIEALLGRDEAPSALQTSHLQWSLLTLAPARHVLGLRLPALCADTRSLRLLAREIVRAYGCVGEAPEPAQYADLAEAMNEVLESEDTEHGRAWWRRQDLSALAGLKLPCEEPGAAPRFDWEVRSLEFPRELSGRVEVLAREHDARLDDVLLAAWHTLLWHLTGQEEIVVGTACDGRTYEEMIEAIGLFARYLPVRARITPRRRFSEVLAEVRDARREAERRQDYFTWHNGHRGLPGGAAPFFPFSFDFEDLDDGDGKAGLDVSLLGCRVSFDRFRARLSAFRHDGSLTAEVHFDAAALPSCEAERLARRFRRVLDDFSADGGRRVGDVDLLGPEERLQLLVEMNDTRSAFPADLCLPSLFVEQARRTPRNVALVARGEEMSYAELEARSGRLARRLRRLGVGPEVIVGVSLERGPELVVALLAVLRAGGAYLPLDQDQPPERLRSMAVDACVSLAIARGGSVPGVPRVLGVDVETPDAGEGEGEAPIAAAAPANLAYVLYTSGSTGRPKGVMVPHRAVVNYLSWAAEAYAADQGWGAPVASPIGFDLTVTSLWAPLLRGKSVFLLPPDATVETLAEALGETRDYTFAKLTPAHLEALSEVFSGGGAEPVAGRPRTLIVGGEALRWESLAKWGSHTRVVNEYGPTEATVGCTAFILEAGRRMEGVVPIGRPIANTRVYLSNAHLKPVPPGVTGELGIAGCGLARGYRGRPRETAESFVPDPWSPEPGERLYRSGDLARLDAERQLACLGRRDHQVKLRGFRVEPGEVEAWLGRHPDVREAAVVTREDEAGQRRLVAYVVTAGAPADGAELRRFLEERLPEPMVPSAFVSLAVLPLTPHGKVDRRALPAPTAAESGVRAAYRAPRNAVEEELAAVWRGLLGVDRVGVSDNFFSLGGDSILGLQVVSRAAQKGIAITARQLFHFQTLEELAAAAGVEEVAAATPEGGGHASGGEDRFPLTPLQQGLLFHSLHETADSAVYFQQLSCDLRGRLDEEAFRRSWSELFERHPILRTAFLWEGLDEPVQKVESSVPVPWRVLDWRETPAAGERRRLAELRLADRRQGFDPSRAPMMRLLLVRLADDRHHFVWSYHHLLLDGWSVPIVLAELFALYEARRRGADADLAPPRPYRDYAEWLRRQDPGRAEAFWRRELGGFTDPTPLPADRPSRERAAREELAGRQGALPVALSATLEGFARRHGLTVGTLVSGAWALQLSRYGGAGDVVFGVVSSGRSAPVPGIEKMVGMFINTLPARVFAPRRATLVEWLRAFQEKQGESFAYEASPLAQVQAWSDVPRGTPLFESLLAFENFPADRSLSESRVAELEIAEVEFLETTNYPLAVAVAPGEPMPFKMLYDRRRFETSTVERMMGHFAHLLADLARGPERRLEELSPLSAGERHQLLREWNDTAAARRPAAGLHELFTAEARRDPAALAVRWRRGELTYGEVDRWANRLAHRLLELGVRRGERVAVFLDRSPAMVWALLGILKAGAAYVPLETSLPARRLRWILARMAVRCIVAEASRRAQIADVVAPLGTVEHVVPVAGAGAPDEEAAGLERLPDHEPPRSTGADDLAYVIFTSGSTGAPKGVAVRHRPALNLIHWVNRTFAVGKEDRALFITSLSFDLSVYDIFGILAAGGSIHVASDDEVGDPERLVELLATEPLTFWDSAPAALQQLAPYLPESRRAAAESALRLAFLSGDWIPPTLPDRVRRAFPRLRVVGLGGATEATVWSNYFPIGDVDPAWSSIPYGRPIENARYHVVDGRGEPCAIGVVGDLFIGGGCLADGYAREGALTADRFLPDPFAGTPGAALYRTGDRARYWPEGLLEFMGRIDHQVKVRGFRIELGEIETVLAEHPAVLEAVALAPEMEPRRRRLAAFYVPRPGAAVSAEELREHLAAALPEYMVPAVCLPLTALPVTPNGKLDRAALERRARPAAEGEGRRATKAPRTAAERTLAAVWRDVLKIEELGIHDNFFELGGDSILSILIVSRAKGAGLGMTPRQLFEHPTVAELAAVAVPATVAADQGPVTGPVELTPIQRWFFERVDVDPHHFNQALLLETPPTVHSAALESAVGLLFTHHDGLRLRFEAGPEGWRQWITGPERGTPFAQVDLSALAEERRAPAVTAVADRCQRSLDLGRGPLLRAIWCRFGEDRRGRLLLVSHHLVVDGVSWRILLEDLQNAYQAQAEGEGPARLPAKTTSFQHWAAALADHARSDEARAEIDHWVAPPRRGSRPLPTDLGGAAPADNSMGSQRSATASLSPQRTRELLLRAGEAYRTRIEDLLLAALVLAFRGWTGERVLAVELEGHGREEELLPGGDLSRTVGWFTTLYPVVLEAGGEGPGAAIKAVKETLRTVPRRGIGFGLLRYLGEGGSSEALADLPRPEVSFNYLGQLDQALAGSELLRPAQESLGAMQSPRLRRAHLIGVNAHVFEGRLIVEWTYSVALHAEETVARLAASYLASLETIIDHCLSPDAGGCTPSDFPLASVDQDTLDRLVGNGRRIEDLYPLSPMQQGMLFHSLSAPRSAFYFEQLRCTLSGELDVPALRRACRRVFERHTALRTGFVWEGLDEPLQVVYRDLELPFETADWRSSSAAEQESRARDDLESDRVRGFDLASAPLLRVSLRQVRDERYLLVWSFHHLLFDGWSFLPLFRDIFVLYEAFRQGEEPYLPPARPYGGYIAWLARQDMAEAEAFWRRELAGLAVPTRVPGDRPAGGAEAEPGSFRAQEVHLDPEATAGLEEVARHRQVTANTVVQGAWALLLARYGGEPDVIFGTVVAGRPPELGGIESMIGLFINTLPLRATVAPARPMAEWLRQLQGRQLGVREHESSPLARVQSWSEVPGGTALFESVMIFENYPIEEQMDRTGELEVQDFQLIERTNFPLTVVVLPGRRLGLRIDHDRQYCGVTAARMARHLARVLASFAEAPDRPMGQIDLLSPAERLQLGFEWTDRGSVELESPTVHGLVEARADAGPDRVAVECGELTLSYAELDRRANRLARRLRALGVGPEVPVGLCVDRSVEMVLAILGILKAGGAYVPLDPSYPLERLDFMLNDSQVPILVTQEHLLDALPALMLFTVLVDAEWDEIALESAERPESGVDGDGLAYVIYTSGSTGKPKGVMARHLGAVHLAAAQIDDFRIGPESRVLQFASLSFDASASEIFTALGAGAILTLPPPPAPLPGPGLASLVEERDVTVLTLPPSAMAAMPAAELPSVRTLVAAGEACPADLVQRWAAGRRFLNAYGPTEITVCATSHPCSENGGPPPIGRPLPDTSVIVAGADLAAAPIGAAGEICLGGTGLTRGYLGRPRLTAGRFVPDPLTAAGGRLYRTGDLGRLRSDGNLDFLGRCDQQVKVRGFRIEPGEIEAHLRAHPGVEQCAVTARESEGEQRLVAYLVPRSGKEPDVGDLRHFLEERVPRHLIPAVFVTLERLPNLPNGKLDRRSLPAPEHVRPDLKAAPVAARDSREALLVDIWKQVLRLDEVGVDDNFFELGGDSILSIEIVSRAGRAGLRFDANDMFEHPTIALLAPAAEEGPSFAAPSGPLVGPVPLLPIQHWFFDEEPRDPHHYNQALLLESSEALVPHLLERTLEHLLVHHDALRLRFSRGPGGWSQECRPPEGEIPFHVVDVSRLGDDARRGAVEAAAAALQKSLDLKDGPLVRLALFEAGEGRSSRLLWLAHHLAVDGVSWRVLLEDLQTLNARLAGGEEPRLPPKTTSIEQWARHLEELAGSAELSAELDEWLAPERCDVPPLPVDEAAGRAAVVRATEAAVTVSLSPEETTALLREVPAAFHTQINDALLTALARALLPWTGGTRLLLDLESHGRDAPDAGIDLSRTVGWLTSVFPVVLDLADAGDRTSALAAVRGQLARIPRRGLGHGLLRYLSPDVETGLMLEAMPAPELAFNYLGQLDQAVAESSPFAVASESCGPAVSPRARRPHLLAIDSMVAEGRFQAIWKYSTAVHRRPVVEGLAERFLAELRGLVESCRDPETRDLAAGEFPMADLDHEELDELAELLDEMDG